MGNSIIPLTPLIHIGDPRADLYLLSRIYLSCMLVGGGVFEKVPFSCTGYALGACTHRFRRFYRVALVAGRLRSWNTYSRTPHRPEVPSSNDADHLVNLFHADMIAVTRSCDSNCHDYDGRQSCKARLLQPFDSTRGFYRFGYFV